MATSGRGLKCRTQTWLWSVLYYRRFGTQEIKIEQVTVQEGSVEAALYNVLEKKDIICNNRLPCAGLRAGKVDHFQSHTDKPAKYSRQTSNKEFNIV